MTGAIQVFHRSAQAQAGYFRLERVIDTSELGVARVIGLSYDAKTGHFTVYGDHTAVKMDLFERAQGSAPPLVGTGRALRAPHPVTGNIFTIDVTALRVYEFTPSGQQVAAYDLSGFGLVVPSALVFAPNCNHSQRPSRG